LGAKPGNNFNSSGKCGDRDCFIPEFHAFYIPQKNNGYCQKRELTVKSRLLMIRLFRLFYFLSEKFGLGQSKGNP